MIFKENKKISAEEKIKITCKNGEKKQFIFGEKGVLHYSKWPIKEGDLIKVEGRENTNYYKFFTKKKRRFLCVCFY